MKSTQKILWIIFTIIMTSNVFGQKAPVVNPSILDDGCTNITYSDAATIVFDFDTLAAIPIPPYTILLPIDSVVVNGFSNVPLGLTANCLSPNCTSYPTGGSVGATENILVSGVPLSTVSNNIIKVYYTYWITAPIVGVQSALDSTQISISIINLDTSVTQIGNSLTANLAGASYQWVDCDNAYAIIAGETNQNFTTTVNGNYAVIIDNGNCVDTSFCYNVIYTNVNEQSSSVEVSVYPNPTKGKLTIKCENMDRVEVLDITGKLVYEIAVSTNMLDMDISTLTKGIYFVRVMSENGVGVKRIVLD
jgi:Secretion system C-terminal sorting domain